MDAMGSYPHIVCLFFIFKVTSSYSYFLFSFGFFFFMCVSDALYVIVIRSHVLEKGKNKILAFIIKVNLNETMFSYRLSILMHFFVA